jgi:[ribosomal protein S5]-alanine N-acetyltransferase
MTFNDAIVSPRSDVSISPLGFEHAENMLRWMNDPEVSDNVGLRTQPSLEGTHNWLRRAIEDRQTRAYAISLDSRHVGNLVFDRIDDYLSNARLSIYIGERDARGTGVGSQALRLGLAEAFERLSLHKVWLTVHVHNTRAIQTYLRAGFVMEGIVRDDFRLNGQLVSAFYMGMLRGEFPLSPIASA